MKGPKEDRSRRQRNKQTKLSSKILSAHKSARTTKPRRSPDDAVRFHADEPVTSAHTVQTTDQTHKESQALRKKMHNLFQPAGRNGTIT